MIHANASMQPTAKIVVATQHYPPDASTTAAIMAAIAGHLATEMPVLVLSGVAGSANDVAIGSGRPAVVEIKNRMGAKTALIRRASAEMLFTSRVFFALLKRLKRGDVVLTVTAPFMLPYAVAVAADVQACPLGADHARSVSRRACHGRVLKPSSLVARRSAPPTR